MNVDFDRRVRRFSIPELEDLLIELKPEGDVEKLALVQSELKRRLVELDAPAMAELQAQGLGKRPVENRAQGRLAPSEGRRALFGAEVTGGKIAPRHRTLIKRGVAGIVDGFILVIPAMAYLLSEPNLLKTPNTDLLTVMFLSGMTYHLYRIWMHARTGQTLGKRWLGLQVFDHVTGATPTLGQAFRRESVACALTLALLVPVATQAQWNGDFQQNLSILTQVWSFAVVLTALFDPERRSMEDRIGNTVVERLD